MDKFNNDLIEYSDTDPKLKRSDEEIIGKNLHAILDGIGDPITIQNKDLDIIWINQKIRELWGDVIGKKCYDVYKGSSNPCSDCYVKEIFNEGKTVVIERSDILPDGNKIDLLITSSPIRDSEGNIIAIIEVEKDITERKKLEQKLKDYTESLEKNVEKRKQLEIQLKEYTENLEKIVEERTEELIESKVKLQGILSGIGDLITIQNKDLDVIWTNQPAKDTWGDVIGKKCYKVYKGLTNPCPDCTVEEVFKEGKIVISERPSLRSDGSTMQILTTSSPVRDAEGNIIAVVEVMKDITEQKKLELQLREYSKNLEEIVEERTKALKESEEKLNAILTGIGDYITIQNKDLDIIWVNKQINDTYGEAMGKKCYEVYKGLDSQCPNCYVNKVFNEGETVISEGINIRPDGSKLNVLVTSSPVQDAEGNIVAVVELTKDISDRKMLEEQLKSYTENLETLVEEQTKALKESKAKLQGILAGIGDLITIQNRNFNIIWANKPMQDIYGEIIGKKCYKVYKGLDVPCFDCTIETVFNEGKTLVTQRPNVLPDGNTMQIFTTSSPVRDAEGNIIAVVEVMKDITEQKKLESALKDSERRYRGLYESSMDGIVSVDMDGNIIECNQAYADMLGYTKEELRKKTFWELSPNKWHDITEQIHREQLFKRGYSDEFEKEYIRKDGTVFPISVRAWVIKDEEGKPIGTWAIARDITDRKRLEKKLIESEELYRGLYESSIDGIVSVDDNTNIMECNKAFADMLGYTKEKLYKLNIIDITASKWHDENKKINKKVLEGSSEAFEKEFVKKDGAILPVAIRSFPIKNREGKVIGIWGVIRDITERKRAEEKIKEYTENLEMMVEERTAELRESEERFRSIFDNANDGILISDLSTKKHITGNLKICQMLGYTLKDLKHLRVMDIHPKEDLPYIMEQFEKAIKREITLAGDIPVKRKDGSVFYADFNTSLITLAGKTYVLALIRDITDRKWAEEVLRESEERYRGLYESSKDGIVYNDMNENILECNQAFADMLGRTKEELFQLTSFDLIPQKWHDGITKIVAKQTIPRGYSDEYEIEGIKKDGTIFPSSVRSWLIKDEEGKPVGTWAIVRDITERRLAEEKIRESEERYRGLYNSSIDGIVSTDLNGKIVDCNQALARMIGYTKEELCLMNYFNLMPSKWHTMLSGLFTEQILQRGYSDEFEVEGIRKDEIIFSASTRGWLIKNKAGNPTGMWGIVRDITERKKVDQMKSQFVNRAAHELRTPLSALKAHVELLDMKSKGMDLPEDINRRISIIMRNAKRLAVLINNLLDYTRLEAGTVKIKKELGSLDNIVSQVVDEITSLAKKHEHELNLYTPEMLPSIKMDKEMIRNVFNNLISNAIKYTPDGGKINVIVREEGDQIHATVKDTGIGIAEEDLEKIFQPFHVADIPESVHFKSEFERTGLGLAIIKEYVKMHGGNIWVESKVGEGSTFHVIIPVDNYNS